MFDKILKKIGLKQKSLVEGLEIKTSDDMFRCFRCRQMQPEGSSIVFVPSYYLSWDPIWVLKNKLKEGLRHGSGYCIHCARKYCSE